MPSELETKQNRVRIEIGLLKERFEPMNTSFEVKQSDIDFMTRTEQGCDMLLSQFRATNQVLDKILSN